MIDAEFKEEYGKYYGEEESTHRVKLNIHIIKPTPEQVNALKELLRIFLEGEKE